jgi:hypothetical protein
MLAFGHFVKSGAIDCGLQNLAAKIREDAWLYERVHAAACACSRPSTCFAGWLRSRWQRMRGSTARVCVREREHGLHATGAVAHHHRVRQAWQKVVGVLLLLMLDDDHMSQGSLFFFSPFFEFLELGYRIGNGLCQSVSVSHTAENSSSANRFLVSKNKNSLPIEGLLYTA